MPRATLARLVEEIARYKPKVLALDVLLIDAGPAQDDEALARALGTTKSVIAAAATFNETRQAVGSKDGGPFAELPIASDFLMPRKQFADQAEVGIVNLNTDSSGAPRAMPMLIHSADRIMLSMPLRVASAASDDELVIDNNTFRLAGRGVPTDVGHLLPMSYYGPRGTIRTIGASRVLAGDITPSGIEGRVVVLGVTVTGGGDTFSTPFDPAMPGVEVLSTAITHLLAKDTLIRNATIRLFDAGFAIALAVLCVALLAWRRNAAGLLAIVAVMSLWAILNTIAYAHGIWMSAALPLVAAGPPTIAFGALQIWIGRKHAADLDARSALMRQFHAPRLRDWILAYPDFLLHPRHQDAAVIFIDLSSFTTLSETTDPHMMREMLKSFHALVDDVTVAHGGLVINFMGDGAMILFGLPQPADDDAARAVQCCIDLTRGAERWLETLPASISAKTGFKIGAHFGEIVASRLGGDSYQHITATGDTVNIASRLMEVAASRGAHVAMTDSLLCKAGDHSCIRNTGILSGPTLVKIRGRRTGVNVWFWQSEPGQTDRS
ncbi:CHASE2 domain-containing protein [Tardiphaga sp.]|uniref:CHASE2 domain-containing protein n=1 Tax=Tardiphaga sp. TaxID=1926292 RepID=UPI0037D99C42